MQLIHPKVQKSSMTIFPFRSFSEIGRSVLIQPKPTGNSGALTMPRRLITTGHLLFGASELPIPLCALYDYNKKRPLFRAAFIVFRFGAKLSSHPASQNHSSKAQESTNQAKYAARFRHYLELHIIVRTQLIYTRIAEVGLGKRMAVIPSTATAGGRYRTRGQIKIKPVLAAHSTRKRHSIRIVKLEYRTTLG